MTTMAKADVTAYKLAQVDAPALLKIVEENFGPGMLRFSDLERIKAPTGGGQTWETIDTLTGEVVPSKTIEGIILAWQPQRAYWPTKYSGVSEPPACASSDAITGTGVPGGDCLKCPFAKYGTAVDEKGKPAAGQACTETRSVLIARPGNLMPTALAIPPTSLSNFRKYLVALSDRGYSYRQVVTAFGLKVEENSTGLKVSTVMPRFVSLLNDTVAARAAALGAAMKTLLLQPSAVADADSWNNAPRVGTGGPVTAAPKS